MAGMRIERRLAELGLELPPPMTMPPAIGVAELPFNIPVEIEAEVAVDVE
jgi:hypothetical protein